MKKINDEKGSLALFVTIAMVFFMIFILAIFVSTTNEQKTQLAVTARIKETYEKDLDNIDDVYNNFVGTDEYIPIYTTEQLKKVGTGESVYVSEVGKYYNFNLNSNYILKNNIELNKNRYTIAEDGTITFTSDAEQWTPIGTSDNPYTGIFDGNEYKISGIYIYSTLDNQGLFGCMQNGTIKSLSILGSITGNNNVGGIVGLNGENGKIENCINECNIIGSQVTGGIVGLNSGTITSCYNNKSGTVNITGYYGAGGIAGKNEKKIENCGNYAYISGTQQVGGIVGNCDSNPDVTVTKCFNIAKVYGNSNVGGIAGGIWQTNKTTTKVTIQLCYNTGNVEATSTTSGGIAGANGGIIINCYNIGNVKSVTNVGGIAGYTANPNTTDNSVGKIINCYSIGSVSGTTADTFGGILGKSNTDTCEIRNCYYLDSTCSVGMNGTTSKSEATPKSSSFMKSSNFVNLLGNTNWKLVKDKNDGYPVLSWESGTAYTNYTDTEEQDNNTVNTTSTNTTNTL